MVAGSQLEAPAARWRLPIPCRLLAGSMMAACGWTCAVLEDETRFMEMLLR